jgi:two-component system phosphate regulon sensor histidine kinase PhoR
MRAASPREDALALALVLGPAVFVLVILAAAGVLAWPAALTSVLAVSLMAALILRWHLRRVAVLRRAIEAFGGDSEAPLPSAQEQRTPLCPGLDAAVAEMARERRRQRRDLQETVAGGEAILTALPDPLLLLSDDGRIVRANPAAADAFEGELAGRDLPSVVRNPALLSAVDAVLRGDAGRVVEFTVPGPVSHHYSARLARLPAPVPDGTVAILALHDVTAIKRVEQMRADFIANASHELRTPLTSLLGFIETLQGAAREDTQARDRFLGVMREQAERMSRLVKDLLSLSRIELQEHTPPRGSVDVGALLQSVARTLEPQAREKDITFVFDLRGVPAVAGEADDLAQVFQNLIDNAVKYGHAGSQIRISAWRADAGSILARRLGRPGVAVSVADRGEGIAREHLPRLTERFYRVDTARSRKLGGTGLGLAIVKHILNRHRGLLDIDSTVGEGSVFTVILPLAGDARTDPGEKT